MQPNKRRKIDFRDHDIFNNRNAMTMPHNFMQSSSESEDDSTNEEDEYIKSQELEDHVIKAGTEAAKTVSAEFCAQTHYTNLLYNTCGLLNCKELELDEPEKDETVFDDADKKWGWKEEVLLLESVKVCGLFNWKRIAILLESQSKRIKFNAKEVQEHFFKYYVDGTLGKVWDYQLVENPVKYIDHTEGEPVAGSSSKYLPLVGPTDLRSIRFLPHREEFEAYPPDVSEVMVTQLDFSSFYMSNLQSLKIGEEMKALQLAIVDSYRRTVAERIALRKFMKDFKLIEQFFYSSQPVIPSFKRCALETHFKAMKKFIPFFDTSIEFLDFYFGCVKEKLLKLEISRLIQSIKNKKQGGKISIQRDSDTKILLEKRAPSFLNVGMLLNSDKDIVLHRAKRKKRKFKFTRRKGSR